AGVTLAAMCVILWQMDALLTLVALLVLPYMIVVFRSYARPMLERSYEQQTAEGKMYDTVEQTLSGIPVIQAFGREEQADRDFDESARAAWQASLATTKVQLWFKVLMGSATALGTAAILWIGAGHALDGRLTVGSLLVFLSYLASLYAPLESLMYSGSTIEGAAGSARRVLEILHTESEVADRPGAPPLPALSGQIRWENVTFG